MNIRMEQKSYQTYAQQLDDMLHKLKKQDPNILCPSGKKVTKLCTSPSCRTALRCNDNKCETCGKQVHWQCLSILMEEITELINERVEDCREMMMEIFRIEEDFIQSLRRRRKQFVDRFMTRTLKEEGLKYIGKIYTEKSFEALTGKQARQLCNELQPDGISKGSKKQKDLLGSYSQELYNQLNRITEIKDKLLTTTEELLMTKPIESKVLELKGNTPKDINYIHKCLNNPTSMELIFRASEHGFNAREFHKVCDSVEDTFVLLRTEFGKTLAAYTHYKWGQVSHGQYVDDSDKRAFLLQLDLHQLLVPVRQTHLIYNSIGYGPTFGGGLDLYISNFCNVNYSWTHIGYTYNHEGSNKYVYKQQESHTAMSGVPIGHKFKIVEYEVFRVRWD